MVVHINLQKVIKCAKAKNYCEGKMVLQHHFSYSHPPLGWSLRHRSIEGRIRRDMSSVIIYNFLCCFYEGMDDPMKLLVNKVKGFD